MASTIRIKRSGVSGDPNTLAEGELAYSAADAASVQGGDRLYIGFGSETDNNAANHIVIGGKFFTSMLDHSKGVLTADSALIVDSNKTIDELNVDNLTFNGNTISTTDADGTIILDPNGSAAVSVSHSRIIDLDEPTDANDAATKNHVEIESAGAAIVYAVALGG